MRHLGEVLTCLEGVLGVLGLPCKGSWASWACLASFLGGLGAFFEPPRSRPRAFFCGLGGLWGACWATPGRSGVVLEICWAALSVTGRLLGGLGWSWAPAGRLWGVPGRLFFRHEHRETVKKILRALQFRSLKRSCSEQLGYAPLQFCACLIILRSY